MLPPKKGNDKDSQQIVSLGIYCNAAGIQSAEKQAQKLASQLALKEFRWDEWGSSQSKNRDRSGYWIEEFEEEIIKHYWSIPNPHWQRAFGLIAAYGISNHELFHVDLDSLLEPPGHLISTYRKNHYGIRRIYCLYPEWYKEWELYKHIDLPQVTGQNNRDLGHRVSTAFRRYGLCQPGDLSSTHITEFITAITTIIRCHHL